MSKKHIGIIACISVIIVCTASIGYIAYSGVWVEWFAGEWHHNYDYGLTITPNKAIYNVTLYLPVPMLNGKISSLVFEAINISKPADWICDIIDTEYGKMLRISAEVITPDYHSIEIRKKITYTINTENPVGNEPIFYPRLNDTGPSYVTHIYADYNTSTDTKVVIYMDIQGSNERGVLGATELEQYQDKIGFYTIEGESHGWHVVNGRLII